MSSYFLAPAAVSLRSAVNAAFPKRDKASDGWIGDPSHAARKSEHNPCWTCSGRLHGIVLAVDLDVTPDGKPNEDLAAQLLRATIGDPRVWYVIHRGKIYSRTYGWQARVYRGHPHDGHVHVSFLRDKAFDTSPWGLGDGDAPVKVKRLPAVSLANVRNAARHPRRATNPVHTRRVQRALNARLGLELPVDGVYGPRTRRAVQAWQRRLGFTGSDADGILGLTSATRLGLRRFRVVR